MNHIFISYRWSDSKSDDDFVEVVNVIEQSTGLTAFWDTRELRSGNFINNLQDGVRSADIFMPVVTQSYLQFGKEGGRDDDKDFCLLEVAAAVSAGKKIVPIFCGVDGNIKTVSDDEARAAAQRVLDLSYTEKEITILQKHLCSQNGVTINEVDAEQISKHTERLCSIVFDTFCSAESDITFFKKYLNALAARLNPIRIFGDFDDRGLTLKNSYVPLSFLRHPTEKERKEKERKENKENTSPTNAEEKTILTDLENEKLAVIVGDAGQGKSSFVRHLTIQLAEQAKQNGLSRELFFPLYFECKNIDRDAMSSCDKFLNELAEKADLSRPALDAVLRFGKPLYIFDAMDEIPPDQMDALVDAIYQHLCIQKNQSACFLFTSRPGQRLLSGEADFTIGNNDNSIVRKYSVKDFDESQQELYISNLAKAKKVNSNLKNTFLQALRKKETVVSDYHSISRNPFMLFAIFSTYTKGQDLPENRFDAISRVIDDVVERDLKKQDYRPVNKKNIKEILGAVSCFFYQQRDMGKTPHASMQTPNDLAESIYRLDVSDRDDRKLLNKCSAFFENSNLFDENGFRHEFLASTYAAYYLLFMMKSKVKKERSPLEVDAVTSLKNDTDYWKGVTEALLCLIDRESEDSKTYIEPLIDELQNAETPDYDTLCRAVSQFVNHQPRAVALLLSGMLERGCDGIESGEQTDSGFLCRKGVNPYEELFYYPAIYPYLQQYLSNLTTGNTQSERTYLCSELIREVCALFSDEYYQKLQNVYKSRNCSAYPNIIKKLTDAADRRGRDIHGYVRVRDGEKRIYSFFHCTELTGITIPDSVTEIGVDAFWDCTGLTDITIPDSVTEIGRDTFDGCTGLTNTNVGDKNPCYSSIDGILFNKEKTVIISYPAGRTGAYTILDSVTEIGECAFSGCTGLTSIAIPDSVTEIGEEAFFGCTGLTSVAIPDSVTEIGSSAFSRCTGLTGITISNSLTKIGECAFSECTGLTNITIPDSVTEIGMGTFWRCTRLTNINVGDNNPCYSSIDGVLFNKEKTVLNFFPAGRTGAYTIPDSVTEIGEDAFSDCKGLTDITILDSVTEIGWYTISGCKGLTSINVGGNNPCYSSIDGVLFNKEKTVIIFYPFGRTGAYTIPDSVIKIEWDAFSGCKGLTGITIPYSVTEIGIDAFSGCTGLTSINVGDNNPCYSSIDGVLFNKEKTIIILYPAGRTGEYTIPDSVTEIREKTFSDCKGLTDITIPDSVTEIGKSAFSGCTGLTDITIPDSVTEIGEEAFSDCTGLTNITIPDSVTEIGEYAFSGCTGLTDITIPDSVTEIGDHAFFLCTGLTDITIPDSVIKIGEKAFSYCTGLTDITIPDSVTEIGIGAFRGCTELTIHGQKGSYAETYAKENNIPFVAE